VTEEQVVALLIEAGRLAEDQPGDPESLLERVQPHGGINRLARKTWDLLTGPMCENDVVALTRGLALADGIPGWSGGSVAGVIWSFQELERRSYSGLLELAEWVIAHDRNPYAPFGTMVHRDERLTSLRLSREVESSILQNARLERMLRDRMAPLEFERLHHHWLQTTFESVEATTEARQVNDELALSLEQAQGQLKSVTEELATLRRRATKRQRSEARSALLRDGTGLSPAERLRIVGAKEDVALGVFPPDWACTKASVLESLDDETRTALKQRLEGRRHGAWRRVYEALCRVDALSERS